MDTAILNTAMMLAMEWGPDLMKPTQDRLRKRFPKLSDQALNDYDATARAAMNFGHAYMYDHPSSSSEQLATAIRVRFPWVSDENLSRVYSQGCYYAWKDGVTG